MGSSDEHRRIAGEFTETVEGTAPAAWGAAAGDVFLGPIMWV
jgi:hypothetical protein